MLNVMDMYLSSSKVAGEEVRAKIGEDAQH